MTLLSGKLFRPWDLPSEDNSKSEDSSNCKTFMMKPLLSSGESEPTFSPDALSTIKRCFNFGDRSKGNNKSKSHPDEVEKTSKQFKSHSDLNQRSAKSMMETYCDSVMDRNNQCPVVDLNLMELGMSNLYPSQLQNSSSSMFLHATAINDLANLSRNELTAMGLLPHEPQTTKVKRQRPKRFHCPHCQVAFSNNGQLRGHIRIHTGERPFSCEQEGCGKSFTRNEELTRHRRIHSGLRPFPCTYCGKKFGRKDHLKKHTRTHQRPVFGPGSGMIGFGNPFHPFNPALMSSHPTMNDFNPMQPSYALPFVLPPPNFPFS